MQFTFAQDGNTFLSDETDNLIMFHGQSILDLVSMETLNNSKIVQKMLQEVPNMENATLEDLGIDFSKNSFFLTEKNGNSDYQIIIAPLTSSKKIAQLFKGEKIEKLKKVQAVFTENNDKVVAWDKNYLYAINSSSSSALPWDAEEASLLENKKNTTAKLLELSMRNGNVSFKNSRIQKGMNTSKSPITAWVNSNASILDNPMYQQYFKDNAFMNMYMGLESFIELDFNKNSIDVDGFSPVEEKWDDTFKKMYGRKIPSTFKNFIQEDALLYTTMAYDMKTLMELMPELKVLLDEANSPGNPLAAMMTPEKIGELIQGDMLLVVNDIEKSEAMGTTPKPSMSLIFSTEQGEFLNGLATNFGVAAGLMTKTEDYYSIQNPMLPMEMGLRIEDGVVLLGSDMNQIKNAKTLKGARLSAKHQDILSEDNFYGMYVNPKIIPTKDGGN
jgi:hypothetical protein